MCVCVCVFVVFELHGSARYWDSLLWSLGRHSLKNASMKMPSFPTLSWSASLKSSRGGKSISSWARRHKDKPNVKDHISKDHSRLKQDKLHKQDKRERREF